ncbi:MAG: zinc ribbon domain-containing protein [Clostridia bacterium]|nr:zinc ribbon domain-containing protein [Clostridia bacterium]
MNFDNILNKAKDVFETAYKKADDAFSVQKQKFDVAGLENKLSKDYEALGKLCFEEMQKGAFSDNAAFLNIAEEIKVKTIQIEELQKDILKAKNKKRCTKCGAAIDKGSVYCNACGQSVNEEE